MHTPSKFLILALTALLTVSCDGLSASQRKQLAAVAKEAISQVATEKESSDKQQRQDAEQKSATDSSDGLPAEGLEIPATNGSSELILHREGYTLSYNTSTRLPNWVAWHLTTDHTKGNAKRGDVEFQEDTDVPSPRANTTDYSRSGYDRGHMCPAGDNKWSLEAMEQSFLMTNICPQAPSLNRGDWNEMEQACRRWAKREGGLYIVCGPILYKQKHKTIGKNKVTVPEAFFKVVLSMGKEPKAIGFIYKNDDGNRPMGDYVNTVDQVERITGIDFFPALPDDIEKQVESHSDLSQWTD